MSTGRRVLAFEDWQMTHGITPWTSVHNPPRLLEAVDTSNQYAFENAYWCEQANKFARLWHEEFLRASRYRAQLEAGCLVPFDVDPYRAADLDEGVA